jgi:hypothetical protein
MKMEHRYRLRSPHDRDAVDALAASIDAAGDEGDLTGPVPPAQLAEIMQALEREWDAADELDRSLSEALRHPRDPSTT